MRALIIGYGSIGRRHDQILNSIKEFHEIHIVTKQSIDSRVTFECLNNVKELDAYDYYLITSETKKHYKQLCWLNNNLDNKKIFCEKPLFDKFYDFQDIKNEVYIGYVLRYHPALQKIKEILIGQQILSAHVTCSSYLPNWRTNIDYRNSYSAKKDEGGGVLLDLSHELDYILWLAGDLIEIKSYQEKLSNLEIDSDDIVSLVGKTSNEVIINLALDYFGKSSQRELRINTNAFTLDANLITNQLLKTKTDGSQERFKFESFKHNDMFKSMHKEILFSSDKKYICDFRQGIEVMKTINSIQDQNQ